MGLQVKEQYIFCNKCDKSTLHKANDLKWNVWLHLILAILTGLFYLIPFVIYYMIRESTFKLDWKCTECKGN